MHARTQFPEGCKTLLTFFQLLGMLLGAAYVLLSMHR